MSPLSLVSGRPTSPRGAEEAVVELSRCMCNTLSRGIAPCAVNTQRVLKRCTGLTTAQHTPPNWVLRTADYPPPVWRGS
jgi:hypothetical protein